MGSKSFLVYVALAAAVLFGVTAFPFMLFMEKQLWKALYYTTREEVTQDAQRLGKILEPHVQHNDTSQIRKVLYSYMNDPHILGILLYDSRGTLLASIRRTGTGDLLPVPDLLLFRSTLPKRAYSINDSLFYEGAFKGRVETYVHIQPLQEETLLFRRSFLYTFVLFGTTFLLSLLLLLHRFLRQPLLEGQEKLFRLKKADSLSLWRQRARKSGREAEEENPSRKPLSFALSRKDEMGRFFTSLQEYLDALHREISQQENNMEALEKNNARLIEELCSLGQQNSEKEQYILELEKRIRLLDEKSRKTSEEEFS